MTSTTPETEMSIGATRLKRFRDRRRAAGETAVLAYLPAEIIQALDAEKAQHALSGRPQAIIRMLGELLEHRSREGENRA